MGEAKRRRLAQAKQAKQTALTSRFCPGSSSSITRGHRWLQFSSHREFDVRPLDVYAPNVIAFGRRQFDSAVLFT
jgi:hypothetical protein